MPWQRHVADVALEVDASGKLVYRQVILTVPRQSGKTTLILALAVHRALGFGSPQVITYTAQTRNDARKKWEDDQLPALGESAFRKLYRTRMTNGNEAVLWRNRSRYMISSTTEKAGHGSTLDLGFADEAFAHGDDRVEQSMRAPMVTRAQPQFWVVSTAGTEESLYLADKVALGRKMAQLGDTETLAYFEWSAPDDADPADPATWWSCMPALGHTVTEEVIASEQRTWKADEFARAYLNRWVKKQKHDPLFGPAVWSGLDDYPNSFPKAPIVLSIDVKPDRSASSIGAAGVRADGRIHVEVVEHDEGTNWVVKRIAEVKKRQSPDHPVMIDPASAAAALLPDLLAAGVEVKLLSGREVAQACGGMYDAVVNDTLRHIGQDDLDQAVSVAKKLPKADAFVWSRRDAADDISPFYAVTFARWGVTDVLAHPEEAGWMVSIP